MTERPSFNVPFVEAINWARQRVPVLPATFYGELPAQIRSRAFTVSGLAAIDQIQRVRDSLARAVDRGESFTKWKGAVSDDLFSLPDWHKELVFRTNVQTAYQAGHWQAQQEIARRRPFLMYDAINDSRTRPSHAALDGYIAPMDDPVWDRIYPPGGFNCRCGTIQLTEAQARARGWSGEVQPPPAEPDAGWEYHPAKQDDAIVAVIERRREACAGAKSLSAMGSSLCDNRRIRRLLEEAERAIKDWDDMERLARMALGDEIWRKHSSHASQWDATRVGLEHPEAVVVRSYTDPDIDVWPLMNRLARLLHHDATLPSFTDSELIRAGLLLMIMDAALEKMPKRAGVFRRGVGLDGLGDRRDQFVKSHTRRGRIVAWDGYTSVMDGRPFRRDVLFWIESGSAVDLAPLSVQGKPELVLPRGVILKVVGYRRADELLVDVEEVDHDRPIRREHRFSPQGQ